MGSHTEEDSAMTLVDPIAPAAHGADAVRGLPMERVNPPQTFWRGFVPALREIWRYHELLTGLVRKELKVKYKGSALGFTWSLLRPMLMLAIYYIAIGKFLASPIPGFVVFLFSGLVAWTFFSDVVNGATQAITANGGLIKKVYFPREILPLSVVGGALVQFGFMLIALFATVFLTGRSLDPGKLLLLPVSLIALVLFSTAVALLMSAANVYLRDTQHLVEVGLLLWFYMTPILYSIGMVQDKVASAGTVVEQVFLANPLAIVAFGFQEAIYQHGSFNGKSALYSGNILGRELVLIGASVVFLWLAQRIFARAQGNFAQEL
jgi:ABC-2 type transport system permease protein